MAKTKRAKPYKFTETKKHSKIGKERQLEKIQGLLKAYKNLFILEVKNNNT
jgi:hypothetical protein